MTDLYDDAAALPRLLRGARSAYRVKDLPQSRGATRWARTKGRLSHPFHGAYLDGPGVADLLDVLRAALLVAPPDAVLAHHTAALLYGFGVVPTGAVHMAVPAGTAVPQRGGVRAHEVALPVDVREVLGLPCVAPARCAVDLARELPRPVPRARPPGGDAQGRAARPSIKGSCADQGQTVVVLRSKHDHSPLIDGESLDRRGAARRGVGWGGVGGWVG